MELLPLVGVRADTCDDERFPTLVGRWVLYCAGDGVVDRARDAYSGEDRTLNVAVTSPVVATIDEQGQSIRVGSLGPNARWETLAAGVPSTFAPAPVLVTGREPIAVAAWMDTVALAFPDHLEISWDGGPARTHLDAAPLPGELAVGAGFVAWTERDESGQDRVKLAKRGGKPEGVPAAAAITRLPVAWSSALAFVADGNVTVLQVETGTFRAYSADTGFLHAPALNGGWVCWEDRGQHRAGRGDLGIACSDGWSVNERGDERGVALGENGLFFRRDKQVFLASAPISAGQSDPPGLAAPE